MVRRTRDLSRREFLELGAAAGVAWASLGELPAFAQVAEQATAAARVTPIRGSKLTTMTHEAIEALGGMARYVHPGETVFIKPNFVSIGARSSEIFSSGDCTKPDVVVVVVEECLKAGAREVIVGEGGHVKSFSWEDAVTMDGETNLAAEASRLSSNYSGNVRLACLESESPAWDEIPSKTDLGTVSVSSLLTRADRVISIPVFKTHRWTAVTFAMKNFVGVLSGDRHGWPLRSGAHEAGIEQCFLDVMAAVKPDLAIVDCSICLEGDGPNTAPFGRGLSVDMKERLGSWLMLAGTDLVAVDATAARIMGHDPADIKQFALAQEQGFGEIREDAIEIVGDKLDNLRVDWKHAQHIDIEMYRRQQEKKEAAGQA
jgi:uncharacterized protein (DUF362 family)